MKIGEQYKIYFITFRKEERSIFIEIQKTNKCKKEKYRVSELFGYFGQRKEYFINEDFTEIRSVEIGCPMQIIKTQKLKTKAVPFDYGTESEKYIRNKNKPRTWSEDKQAGTKAYKEGLKKMEACL